MTGCFYEKSVKNLEKTWRAIIPEQNMALKTSSESGTKIREQRCEDGGKQEKAKLRATDVKAAFPHSTVK